MRQRSAIELVTQRGEVRLQIDLGLSNIAPEWWELRKRFRWWRLNHAVRNNREILDIETQAALAWAEEALGRELRRHLYGRDYW